MDSFVTDTMDSLGYVGIALLMLLENIIPPIPSEIVMPAAGASARSGQQTLWGVVLAGTVGSVVGALPWYGIAWYVGTDRLAGWMKDHGHWLGADEKTVHRADAWFDRYGEWAVLGCRMVPGLRTLISVPAGFSEMPMMKFLIYTTIGTAGWSLILALLGYWLQGQKRVIAQTVQWIGLVVFMVLFVWFVVRIIRRRWQKSAGRAG